LRQTIEQTTAAFEAYDYTRALETTERYFWTFCDDYVELVKQRAYGDDADPRTRSARATLLTTLDVLLRLFAPIMPFVTEEAWSWWNEGSIHRAPWPQVSELGRAGEAVSEVGGAELDAAAAAIGAIRKAKSEARLAQKAEVARLTVTGPRRELTLLSQVLADVRAAGHVTEVELVETTASNPAGAADVRYEVTFGRPTGADHRS
jgi:valyl-tRNA synthetase